jgi:hypothetical protein
VRNLPPRAQRVGVEKRFEHLSWCGDDHDRDVEAWNRRDCALPGKRES